MSEAQFWFLVIMINVVSVASLVAQFTDWYERPPLSWLVAVNCWIGDRLIRPWLDPVPRPDGHRAVTLPDD